MLLFEVDITHNSEEHRHVLIFLFKVQPKHVKEAFRLLNKSIIRVETPDVQFDEEEDEQHEGTDYHIRYSVLKSGW